MSFSKKFSGLPRNTGRTTGNAPKKTPRDMQKHPAFQSERTLSLGAKNRVINKDITRMKLRAK